jgi:hypothetical protein
METNLFVESVLLVAVLAMVVGGPQGTACAQAAASSAKTVWLDDLDLSRVTTGWGAVGRRLSVDGGPIRLAGKTYKRGIGIHAVGTIHLALDGQVARFESVVGLDDEAADNPRASVRFLVVGDGKTLFDSRALKGTMTRRVDMNLEGVKLLSLLVDDAGDGVFADHADWADARFTCRGAPPTPADRPARWILDEKGAICWDVSKDRFLPHADHIEMSGLRVSAIVDYGVDAEGHLSLNRHIVWPMLRTIPNNTHGSLARDFGAEDVPRITVDGVSLTCEKPIHVSIRGMLAISSATDQPVLVKRTVFPSVDQPALLEKWDILNTGKRFIRIGVSEPGKTVRTEPEKGVDGEYILRVRVDSPGDRALAPGATRHVYVTFDGAKADSELPSLEGASELAKRSDLVRRLWGSLRLETPDPRLNRAFAFAKLRGAESIFATRGGLMHGPGGGKYYAALWTNDQCEYVNPLFPFLGYPTANEQSINCYRHFARHMAPDFERDLVSSVIAEGRGIWNGARDRGDAAMYAYGAARFALAYGRPETAEELWPAIEWCLEYCRRKTGATGVVASDCDELENRFPAGEANLCTSSLAYDALLSAAWLGEELGKDRARIEAYRRRAGELRRSMESHFGADLAGFRTYRYYEGNTSLRAWICIPLTVGIHERAEGTVAALFSPHLWTVDGLATEAGKRDFWDRSTLYALRGTFAAGATGDALSRLQSYTGRRLLGEHVPYAIEAWPENNQRHLSAESGLYCRIYTEGLFGIRPTGFSAFDCTPRLPEGWDHMALRDIQAFQNRFDLVVEREGKGQTVCVEREGKTVFSRKTELNATVSIRLPAE